MESGHQIGLIITNKMIFRKSSGLQKIWLINTTTCFWLVLWPCLCLLTKICSFIWNSQLHEQVEFTSCLLLDANISQDFTVISNFIKDRWDAESVILPDCAASSPPGKFYSISIGIDLANLNISSSDELVTSFQAGYHVSHNGFIFPIFVSSIYDVNQNLRTTLGIRIMRVLELGYIFRTYKTNRLKGLLYQISLITKWALPLGHNP